MKEVILIKNGELALKGLNRSSFESLNIRLPCSTPHRLSRSRQSARTRSFRSILPRYAERSAERYSQNSTI